MNLNKLPKLIIFDWDNTLIDTSYIIGKVVNRLRADMNKPELSDMEILELTGDPDMDWIQELFGEKSDNNQNRYNEYYNEVYGKNYTPTLLQNSTEILDLLDKIKLPYALLTNKGSELAKVECEYFNFTNRFIKIVGRDDIYPNLKPHTLGIEMIVNEYKTKYNQDITPDEIWFVGDTLTDMKCAINYKCHTIFVGLSSWIKGEIENDISCKTTLSGLIDIVNSIK